MKVLRKAKESFAEKERYYDFGERNSLFEPELTLDRIFGYLGVKSKEFEKFEKVEKGKFIVHFERVRFRDGEGYEEIRQKIEEIKKKPEYEKKLSELFKKGNQKEYDRQRSLFEHLGSFEMENQRISIKYLANHYYLPVILSETEKIDYLNHIINVDSEVKFIEQLEEYLAKPDNVFTQFDWWMFSKLDQTLDEVFIPYWNQRTNRYENYHPDFIFWFKPKNSSKYLIVFVDPHAPTYTDSNWKIDGYRTIFEENGQAKLFPRNRLVKLLMWGPRNTGEEYKDYWVSNFVDFAGKIN